MPMIIKNGKRYCSTGGEAENIVYDNTNSGLDSTNMQDAIDELNSNLDGISFVVDSTGKITGYTTNTGGADTVFPFSSDEMNKSEIIKSLQYSDLGLTEDSSWADIIEALTNYFAAEETYTLNKSGNFLQYISLFSYTFETPKSLIRLENFSASISQPNSSAGDTAYFKIYGRNDTTESWECVYSNSVARGAYGGNSMSFASPEKISTEKYKYYKGEFTSGIDNNYSIKGDLVFK